MRTNWMVTLVLLAAACLAAAVPAGAQERRMGKWGKGRQLLQDEPGLREPYRPLTEAEIAEIKEFLQKENPEQLEQLDKLKDERPVMYEKVLFHAFQRLEHLKRLEKKDPEAYKQKMEMFRLDTQVRALVKEYRDSDNESRKAKIKKELVPLLGKLFDLRQEDRKLELKHLKERVSELEGKLSSRAGNKEKIVENHLNKLLGKADDLDW